MTVIVTDAEAVQPLAFVPVTVYVWVAVSVAVTGLPVVADKPVAGAHVYVFAPLAVKTVATPEHTVTGETVITGSALTVMVADPV